jgi:hypothetical protein
MSPEQAAGGIEAIDQRTDVFALGATLYHVLTSRAPYVAKISKALEQARSARVVPPEELSEVWWPIWLTALSVTRPASLISRPAMPPCLAMTVWPVMTAGIRW